MTTDIHKLLNKYFEGETTSEEEKSLRNYFSQENTSEDLLEIAPIFTFLEDEATALAVLDEIRKEETTIPRKNKQLRTIIWTITTLVASFFIAILLLQHPGTTTQFVENQVWVNGKKITDSDAIRYYAEESFSKVKSEENILEDQLNFMFE